MDIFDKFQPLNEIRQTMEEKCGEFFNFVIKDITSPTEVVVNDRTLIHAGSNNYLGLTFEPDCIQASCTAAQNDGTGTTGSRMANGTYAGHLALEQELSDYFGRSKTIIFTTGYTANLAMLSTVVGSGDVILIDADCHASIYDGCLLGNAEIIRFRHNDTKDLEKRLERLKKRQTNVLVVVEGLYSMFGDRAPLADIAAIKNKYGAYLLVDEAHSLGVLGHTGRGLAEEADVEDSVDFIVGTFSKSLGSIGGFCTSNHSELDLVRYASRPYVFTASPSPATIASTRAALRLLPQPERRRRLWDSANFLYGQLKDMGFNVGPEVSPVIAIRFSDPENAYAIWNGLLEKGIYVNMVLPPATPDGAALLRCSLSAAHTKEQINKISKAFESLSS